MMARNVHLSGSVASWIAAVGFLALVVFFGLNIRSFHQEVVDWAMRDLSARAQITAENLREPLETQDFRRIREVARMCREQGFRLAVQSRAGGQVFSDLENVPSYAAVAPLGEYRIHLTVPVDRVNRPFKYAVGGFVLALFVGLTGMLLVILTLYRQRIRIQELAKLEAFRREFIADVSHELKTPLTGILGASDLLKDAPEAMRPKLIEMIQHESKRLNQLAQEILSLSRLEREGYTLNKTPVDLTDLVRETAERLRPQLDAARMALSVNVPSVPVTLACDAQLIEQVLTNLMGNALRHAQSPDVLVELTQEGSHAVLTVEDHGIGIPPEERARVFERFHRLDPARAAETGGAGLGLSIVQRIVNLHNGTIRLEPSSPHGCRFIVTL